MKKPRWPAVVFDLDGTLLNTLEDLCDATNRALVHFGYPPVALADFRYFVGNGVRHQMACALPGGENDPLFDKVTAYYKEDYAAHCRVKTAPYPGVVALLHRLRAAGARVAVVSNKFASAVRTLCDECFEGTVEVAVGEMPGLAKKPAPDMVDYALAELGVSRAEAVYIGDSDVDFATAQNAGLPCVSVLWGFRDRPLLEGLGATRFASTVDELEALLLSE